jgi:hypothetical protein
MRYTLQSIQYFFKNLLYILPLTVLPALLLSLSMDVKALDVFATAIISGNRSSLNFTVIFHAVSVFNFHSVGAFFAQIASVVFMVVCVAFLMALIDKHMRIGKRTFNGMFSKLNDNFLSTAGMCLLFSVIYSLWALIISATLTLVNVIDNNITAYCLSAILFFASQFILNVLLATLYLWLPCLQITGFRPFEALRYSNQLVSPVIWTIAWGQFLSLTFAEIAFLAIAYFSQGWVLVAFATALYTCMISIFCVRMQIVYFDRAQMERMDLKKYYHF